jgi:uncharacterized membrane protein YeaQ/YmgE (transglycosylase-associated protein family)
MAGTFYAVRPQAAGGRKENGMNGILSWIVFGLVAGVVAKALTPGRDGGGCIVTVVIGVVGALLGGYLATLLGFGGLSGFDVRSLVIAILGAVLLLVL